MTAEWRHVTGRFYAFIAELAPAPDERQAARAAVAEVAGLLARRFQPRRGHGDYDTGDAVVVGGHAKGTAIRPGRAIDLLYAFPGRLRGEASANGSDLAPLHRDVVGVLSLRYAAVRTGRDGWLTVTTGPRNGAETTTVRLLPVFACADGGFVVAAADRVPWRRTDPRAEARHLRHADAVSGGKAGHLVRMLKAWRDAGGVPIGSFAIELLAAEFVTLWTYPRRSLLFYDWMVRDFFFWMTAQAGRTLAIPGPGEALPIGEAWQAAAGAAYEIAAVASDLERDNRGDEALALWRRLFGPAFGPGVEEAVVGAPETTTPTPLLVPALVAG